MRFLYLTTALIFSFASSLAADTYSIANYQLVSSDRVGLPVTQFRARYSATLVNTDGAQQAVAATVASLDPNIVVEQGTLNFAPVPANSQVASNNTFTLVVNRSAALDFSKLQWIFSQTANGPASIIASGGTPQSASLNAQFAAPLSATVLGLNASPVSGVTVTFTAPSSGPSGAFAGGGNTATATTNASGLATSPLFTANSIAGIFSATASVAGVSSPAVFSLTNSGQPSIAATGGTPQSAPLNTPFGSPLIATFRDALGNLAPNVTVTFTAPASGPGGSFAGGVNTAATNASGVAVSPIFTANGALGGFMVTATAPGVAAPAPFSLNNVSRPIGPPTSIVATGGTPQSAQINTVFGAPLAVTITDKDGNPVSGVTVTFAAPGSGASGAFSGGANTAVTNASGVATSMPFTANALTGNYVVTASAGLATTATFALKNTPGPPASVSVASGTQQSAQINAAFGAPLVATVKDAGGNLLSGITVTFTAPGSGASGNFTGGTNAVTAMTDNSGNAVSPVFTANGTQGSFMVVASVPGATSANFSLTNTQIPLGSITATGGTPQSAPVTTAFGTALAATVKDANGNPVSGVTVTFMAPSSGPGGSFGGAGTATATTNASGVAIAPTFTANTLKGDFTVMASAPNTSTQASFALTNLPGPAATITTTSGTPQSAQEATAFASPLAATVKDANGNPVSGANVTFTAPAGGASGTFTGGTNTVTVTTDASGIATSTTFTANKIASAASYTVTATVPGVGTPANFSLTNLPGPPVSISATAGTPQTVPVNTAFAPLAATVKDIDGNPVGGVTVTFAMVPAANGASGTFANGANTAVTDASGVATAGILTANAKAGSFTVTASANGVATSATFSLKTVAGAAAAITATSGTPQSAVTNAAFGAPLVATVTDAGGNPVSGVTVAFTAPSSGASGAFTGGTNIVTAVTDASGVATSTTFTANGTPGGYTVTASAPGVSTPANFVLTNTTAAAAAIAVKSGSGQSAPVTTAFAAPLAATVTDGIGNPVSGVTVTFTPPSSGASGTFAGGVNTAVTDASGVATSAVFTANTIAGTYTVAASAAGVGTPANFSLTNTNGPAASIVATSGTPQATQFGTTFPAPLVATVKDANGNPVGNVTVTFAAPGGGASGTFAGGVNTAVTNASGIATSTAFTANGTVGGYTVAASVAGVVTSASFALTNQTGNPGSIAATGGTPQSAPVGTTFAAPLMATVKDAGGNPLSGVTVTFTAPGSGASGSFAGGVNTAVTNGSGIATSAAFTANSTAGGYAVTASAPGVATPASFALTNQPLGGSGGIAVANTSVGQNLQNVVTITLSSPAPTGGLNVTVSSADQSKLLVADRPSVAGSGSVVIPIGASVTTFTVFVQGLASSGAVTLTASEPSLGSGTGTITLTPSGFVLTGPNGNGVPSFTTGVGINTPLTVTAARLDSSLNFAEAQSLRAGISASVAVTSSNTGVGTVSPSPLNFTGGSFTSATTQFNALAPGSSTLAAVTPAGFTTPGSSANMLTASVSNQGITAGNATVGQNLETTAGVTLTGAAPSSGMVCDNSGPGLCVTLTSNDPSKLSLRRNQDSAGSGSIMLPIPAGLNRTQDFFVQGLASSGTVTYTASAPGFGSGTGTVTLTPSGIIIAGPAGIGQPSFIASTGGSPTQINVFSARLDSAGNYAEIQQLRTDPAVSATVPVTSSNTAVGTITTSPVTINGGGFSAFTFFQAVSAGSSVLSVGVPAGFTAPNQNKTVTANVSQPGISITDQETIGMNLEIGGTLVLGQSPPPGGVTVTLTSNDPSKLLLSTSATAPGMTSITVLVTSGNSGAYFIQALASSGSATYTATAPGFKPRTATVFFGPSGFVLSGPFGVGSPFTIPIKTTDPPAALTVFAALLDASGNLIGTQQLAGGFSATAALSSSAPTVGTVSPATVTIPGGSDNAPAQFTPKAAGSTTVSVSTAPGSTAVTSAGSTAVTTVKFSVQ